MTAQEDRVRTMLADLKMPGALEAVDGILAQADSGATIAGEPIEQLLGAQIMLRNNRRLETAMRSSHLPLVKTLAQFDFSWTGLGTSPRGHHRQRQSISSALATDVARRIDLDLAAVYWRLMVTHGVHAVPC